MKNKKITFANFNIEYIYTKPCGYEIPLEKSNIPIGHFSRREIPKVDRIYARNYLKGLKILFKRTLENHAFDDVLGNYSTIEKKYKAILKSMQHADIEAIGQGKNYRLTFYVDGSVSHTFEN